MRSSYIYILFIILFSNILAQDDAEFETQPTRQGGLVFTMAETGSGLGGFMAWPLANNFHFGISFDAFSLRDSKQFDYYDYYYNIPITINKKNNVYLFDLFFTIKKRFFAEEMEESFRPFLTAAVGPTFGMNFPEHDIDEYGNPTQDQFRWTLGGFLGGGVDISFDVKYFVGIRAQYRLMPFAKKLGESSNHSMFEIRFEVGQRF
jgi:hypothetical protein